jgi:acetyl-CoA carboxylase biotin carboxyl carrier protein
MKIQLDDLKALISALEAGKVSEFEYEDETSRIRLSFGAKAAPVQTVVAAAAAAGPAALPAAAAVAPVDDSKVAFIVSPIVGTFYRSPSPESPPFVDVGSQVKVGQAVCIVEAMKLMNEIESDVAGTVLEVLVENGHSVEFGQRLFKIKKSD